MHEVTQVGLDLQICFAAQIICRKALKLVHHAEEFFRVEKILKLEKYFQQKSL